MYTYNAYKQTSCIFCYDLMVTWIDKFIILMHIITCFYLEDLGILVVPWALVALPVLVHLVVQHLLYFLPHPSTLVVQAGQQSP